MQRLRFPSLLLVGLFATLSVSQQLWAGTLSTISSSRWVTVSQVSDGDTFRTEDGEKVRILGINTPEIAYASRPGQPLGKRAKQHLQSLIEGELVRLAFDREIEDVYERTLAHVYLRDGRWINAMMVEAGLAQVYTFAPNFRHTAALLIKEQEAREKRLGIWKTSRFKLLSSKRVDEKNVGQFRLVSGKVDSINKNRWGFKLGKLSISIPRAYRKWFDEPLKLKRGDSVVIRGKVRISSRENLFIALHSPYDLEIVSE